LCYSSIKEELGAAAGLGLGAVAVALTDAGDAKDLLKEF
jgi:ribosomal protein L7Ae-like RNA K-turn-binding protein